MNAYKSSTSNDQSLPNFIDSQNLPPFLCPLCRSASPTISEIFLEKKTNIPCISYKCKCSKNPQKETQIVSLPHLLLFLNEIKPKCFQHPEMESFIYCPICKIYMCQDCHNYHNYFKKEHNCSISKNRNEYKHQIQQIQKHLLSMFNKFNAYIKKEITIIDEMIDKMTKLKNVIEQNQNFIYDTNSYLIKFMYIIYNDYYNSPETNVHNVKNLLLKNNLIMKTDSKFLDKVILNFNKIIKAFNLQQKDMSHRMVIDLEETLPQTQSNNNNNNNNEYEGTTGTITSTKGTFSTNDNTHHANNNTNNNNTIGVTIHSTSINGNVNHNSNNNNTSMKNIDNNNNKMISDNKNNSNNNIPYGKDNTVHSTNNNNNNVGMLNYFFGENNNVSHHSSNQQNIFRIKKDDDDFDNKSNNQDYINDLNIVSSSNGPCISDYGEGPRLNIIPVSPSFNKTRIFDLQNNNSLIDNKMNFDYTNTMNEQVRDSQSTNYQKLMQNIFSTNNINNRSPNDFNLNYSTMILNDLNILPISTQTCLYSLSQHDNEVTAIIQLKHFQKTTPKSNNNNNNNKSLSEFSNAIISAGLDNNIIIYNSSTFRPISKLPSLNLSITAMIELTKGFICIAYSDYSIHLFSLLTNQFEASLIGHSNKITSLIQLDNCTMLSASEDNSIKIWDISKKKCIKTLTEHTSCVNALLYINNKSFASCSEDNFIFIWNVGNIPYNCKVVKKMNGHEGRINCMCNVDDIAIATGSNDKTIKIWNINNCSCVGTLFGHNGSVNQIIKSSISDQERIILISVSDDKSVKIWNVNQRQCIGEIENAHIDKVKVLQEIDDGKIITAGENGVIKVWV